MKKLLLFVAAFTLSLTLSVKEVEAATPDKLVIWSFTDELETSGDIAYFEENFTAAGKKYEGMEIEFVIIPTADYLTTILPVLETGVGAPDVFTGELDMIQNFMEGGYLADLEALMKADSTLDFDATKADFQSYIWESGTDLDGTLRALSWQVTPGAIFFKTDMAEAVWGDEAGFPSETDAGNYNQNVSDWVSENKFDSLENLVESSKEVKAFNANWRLFPNDDAIRFFAKGTDDSSSWIGEDGKINPAKLEEQKVYMQTVADMYGDSIEDSLTANIGEWSGEWFGGLGKSFKDAEGNEYQTMAYSLPTWGLFYVIAPNVEVVDANGDTCAVPADDASQAEKDAFALCTPKGNWGMASGPNSYFWGGTYLGIRKGSDATDAAYDFVSSMLFDTERMTARAANGDVYSRISVMNDILADYPGNDVLGGMNHYTAFLAEAEKISFENVTKYDRQLDTLFGTYVTNYKRQDEGSETMEEAFNSFYKELKTTYFEIYTAEGLPFQEVEEDGPSYTIYIVVGVLVVLGGAGVVVKKKFF